MIALQCYINFSCSCCFSVTKSCPTDSLWPHGLQHARFPCPSPSSRTCSNSHPLSQWCHPTISSSVIPFSSCIQSFPASVFSSESVLHIRWPQCWNFSFSISLSNEYSGFISFRIDWFDLLAVQGTLKGHLHHQSSKASILWRSAFFTVQLSHLYMTTGKTIGLTRQTFVSKVSAVEQHESTICIHIYPSSSACLFFELISFSSAYVENPLGHIFEVEICSL